MKKGRLVLVYGPMFSGKTLWLMRQIAKQPECLVFKPSLDNRYSAKAELVSHSKKRMPAILVSHQNPEEIVTWVAEAQKEKRVEMVMVDELNFFSPQIEAVFSRLKDEGKTVIAAGLLLDSERHDFGPMRQLFSAADEVYELFARCDYQNGQGKCAEAAAFNYAKKKKSEQVAVGAAELYGVACERHYSTLAARNR